MVCYQGFSYGNICKVSSHWWNHLDPGWWGSLSRREIRHPAWKIAWGYPHRRREWLVLFPAHKLDFSFDNIVNYDQLDFTILGKVKTSNQKFI
jgi:hypothetical protein